MSIDHCVNWNYTTFTLTRFGLAQLEGLIVGHVYTEKCKLNLAWMLDRNNNIHNIMNIIIQNNGCSVM